MFDKWGIINIESKESKKKLKTKRRNQNEKEFKRSINNGN